MPVEAPASVWLCLVHDTHLSPVGGTLAPVRCDLATGRAQPRDLRSPWARCYPPRRGFPPALWCANRLRISPQKQRDLFLRKGFQRGRMRVQAIRG